MTRREHLDALLLAWHQFENGPTVLGDLTSLAALLQEEIHYQDQDQGNDMVPELVHLQRERLRERLEEVTDAISVHVETELRERGAP